ncbi:MAG: NAD-dependent epimerase/dehydratase family protein [Terrimicrobiaceae bacterium]|nr:NAD-dependent epimerase/dehydratase family protein [Terrimicrobiaceae bacterium]
MKCVITGASGFLGGAVGRAASDAGCEVVAIGRAATPPPAWPGDYRSVDFSSPDTLAAVMREEDPDCVLHFAGAASVGESFAAPLQDFEASASLWFRVLEAIRRSGRRPMVALASSAAVYGSPVELPISEAAACQPESPYGFHKLLSEQMGVEFACCFGLSIVSLRFFSVFGPRQRRLLVWEIFDQLRAGMPELRLKGTGDERRDFLAEDEAAAATIGVVKAMTAGRLPGFRAVNMASGASVAVRDVAEAVRDCADVPAKIVFGREMLRGNPAHWQADVAELRRLLPGWQPRPFAKSLAACVAAWDTADRPGARTERLTMVSANERI